ncbi:MAG TPA: hypothetical protein VLT33_19945 [Labilithrix sp.]|nr:hypothetical protein [Labilithrix sp.]
MRNLLVGSLLGGVMVAATAAACGDAANNSLNGARGNTPPATIPAADGDAGGDGINTTGAGAGTGAVTGLPCDVQQLLENRCIGCHLGASPPPVLTYDDLLKPAPSDPSKTMAQKSLERLKSTTAPMPPAPAVAPTAAEIATFEKWVAAGTPKGATCTALPGDGGAPEAGAGTNYNTPTVCTSNKTFPPGADNSSLMKPGGACVTCHTMQGGPSYTVAGTVYPTAHEPNDCNGVNGGLTVVVTDANGAVTNIPVNSVGNFSLRTAIAPPFKVKVTNGTKERVMAGSLTAGDCNSCHTLAGANGAPGRVMAP